MKHPFRVETRCWDVGNDDTWGRIRSAPFRLRRWVCAQEGFAEFSGILYTLYSRGADEYFRLLQKNRENLLNKNPRGIVYDQLGPLYAGQRLSSARHPAGYSVVVYGKGAWVLHMLRQMLYDPGNRENADARFMTMMQDFTKSFYNQPASTDDFKTIVDKHMTPQMDLDRNKSMDWFFDAWVYGTGIPRYELEYTIAPEGTPGRFSLRGTLRQSGVPLGFRMIVPFFLHQETGFFRVGWLKVLGPVTPFQMTLGFQPQKVTINEWQDVLSTVEYK